MNLSRTVWEIKGDFCRKSQIFPTPVYLTSPLKGFPLEFGGTDTKDQQTRTMGLLLLSKQFYIRLAVYTQYRRVTDRQTDRRTRDDCKDRAYITHSVARVKTCYFSQLLSKWRPIHWFVTLLYFSQNSVFFLLHSLSRALKPFLFVRHVVVLCRSECIYRRTFLPSGRLYALHTVTKV